MYSFPEIRSVLPRGNGAYIVHSELANTIAGYQLQGCNPFLAAIPSLPIRELRHWLGQANIVHLSPNTGHIPLAFGIPRVITFHSFDIDNEMMDQASIIQKLYYKTVLRSAVTAACASTEHIVAVSRFVADCIIKHGLSANKSLEVIYNGIDTNRFQPTSSGTTDGRPIRVLFVGNPSRRKGFHFLAELAEHLPKGVEIAFTAGLRNKKTDSPHPQLIPLGAVPYSAIHKIYQEADILLFPAYREGFGLCVAEAMACGLPVISSNCSAIPELIIDGVGGFLLQPGNFHGLLEKLLLLIKEKSLRESMGAWNRARAVKHFDRQSMATAYQATFSHVLRA